LDQNWGVMVDGVEDQVAKLVFVFPCYVRFDLVLSIGQINVVGYLSRDRYRFFIQHIWVCFIVLSDIAPASF